MACQSDDSVVIPSGDASLQSIRYQRGSLRLLDQRKLPLEETYLDIRTASDGCRPTAVNLSDAATKLKGLVRKVVEITIDARSVFQAYIDACEAMLTDDVTANKAIGLHGADHVKGSSVASKKFCYDTL